MAFDKNRFLSLHADLSVFEPAGEDEKAGRSQMRESSTFFKDGIARLKKNRMGMACLVMIVVIALIAVFVPMIYPYDYETTSAVNKTYGEFLKPFQYSDAEQALRAEGKSVFPHIMGTDSLGRDYAIRVIFGARISLLVGFVAAFIVVVIGVLYGSVAGYLGGKADLVMMRLVDVIYSLPDMLLIILISLSIKDAVKNGVFSGTVVARLGPGMVSIFLVFGLLYWVGMARLVRGQVLSLKNQEFVLAARACGARGGWIVRKHMIANSFSVIIISAALQVPSAIFTESYLSFLGLGVEVPTPSLGWLTAQARGEIISHPYLLVFPALAILLVILSLNLLGNALRDAFDPKLKERGMS